MTDFYELQLTEFGLLAANWAVRSAIERCSNAGLPKVMGVMGVASVAVGPADTASGVKLEKLDSSALATSAPRSAPVVKSPVIVTNRALRGRLPSKS